MRQATRRSPGKSGELISARSCSSNRDSCSGPSSAISLRMAGARSAVIHPYFPSSSRIASMRAVVIMPRSPTITILRSPNSPCTTSRISVNAGGVGGVPLEHADRDRPALGVGEQPVLDLHLALLAVAGVAARPQRAAPALQPRAGQVEQRHPGRVRGRGEVPAGELALDRVLPGGQPVHRRVRLVGGGVLDAEVGAERDVAPPGQGGQLGARRHDPRHDQGQGQVPRPAGRAEQRGQAERAGHRVARRRRARAAATGRC